jgi:hypothetical protein
MNWLWLIVPLVFVIAGAALWYTATRPGFWIEVVRIVSAAFLPDILKRKSAADEAIDHQHARENTERPKRQQPHPEERGRH